MGIPIDLFKDDLFGAIFGRVKGKNIS